jgi:hypothetical protein
MDMANALGCSFELLTDLSSSTPHDFSYLHPIMLSRIGKLYTVDNSKSKRLLGMTYERDLAESLGELKQCLIKSGIVK